MAEVKITTKTKKAELVVEAIRRKLYADEETANKATAKELYQKIKYDMDKVVSDANTKTEEHKKEDVAKSESKSIADDKSNKNESDNVVSNEQVSTEGKVTKEMVEQLNDHFNGGRTNQKNGKRKPLPKKKDKVVSNDSKVSEVALANANKEKKPEVEKSNVVKMPKKEDIKNKDNKNISDEDARYESEAEARERVIESFVMLRDSFQSAEKENKELKKENAKLLAKIDNLARKENSLYVELVNALNQIANTRDQHYIWIWKLLSEYSNRFSRDGDAPILLDIEKLIIEESIRKREEEELQRQFEQKKLQAEADDVMYEGSNISYIDGEMVNPGIKKKTFKAYESWGADALDWVTLVIEELGEADKICVKPKRNKAIKDIKDNLEGWYEEWSDAGCDEDVVSMVRDTMNSLIEHRNIDKAMSNIIAIIDELDYDML